jgi:hypothetical protein
MVFVCCCLCRLFVVGGNDFNLNPKVLLDLQNIHRRVGPLRDFTRQDPSKGQGSLEVVGSNGVLFTIGTKNNHPCVPLVVRVTLDISTSFLLPSSAVVVTFLLLLFFIMRGKCTRENHLETSRESAMTTNCIANCWRTG